MPLTQTNGFSAGFDLRRAVGTTRGLVSEIEPRVARELSILEEILSRPAFQRPIKRIQVVGEKAASRRSPPEKPAPAAQVGPAHALHAAPGSEGEEGAGTQLDEQLKALLELPLKPRKVNGDNLLLREWAPGSLLHEYGQAKDGVTLSELVDATPELAAIKYAVRGELNDALYTMSTAQRAVLQDHPAITDYLIAYAYFRLGFRSEEAVENFLLRHPFGAGAVARYATVSAARAYVAERRLTVSGLEKDDSPVTQKLLAANLSLDADAFTDEVDAIVHDCVFNDKEEEFLDQVAASLGGIPPKLRPLLVGKLKSSPIKLSKESAPYLTALVSSWIDDADRATRPPLPEAGTAGEADGSDAFAVEFLDDDRATIQISRTAVRCAAQMFYGMTLGDELEIFNVMNFFTHRYLVRGSLTIEDPQLREDLQAYVFSSRFVNRKTGQMMDRTRPAERAMFYRQVFDFGSVQVGDDSIVNEDFQRLWKVLMLESAKYLERAQLSPNPEAYVSRQSVLQAVEDLQYNLSTHCTGMSNVIAPLIYAELDFVIRRIFMHKEVMRQIAPQGGTWWRVVEALYQAMKNERPRATVLYNKAKVGHDILQAIANYDAATYAKDQPFAELIGDIERFINTVSIQQDAAEQNRQRAGGTPLAAPVQDGPAAAAGAGTGHAVGADEPAAGADAGWNF